MLCGRARILRARCEQRHRREKVQLCSVTGVAGLEFCRGGAKEGGRGCKLTDWLSRLHPGWQFRRFVL